MYNLFVTSQDGAWDQGHYSFDKSRYLEYTNAGLSSELSKLDPQTIEKLIQAPCIFAYEGTDHDVRIGFLTDIRERDREILIEFEFVNDVQPFPYSELEPIVKLLDIRDWEMNRTHWAVKGEDLRSRLSKIGKNVPKSIKNSPVKSLKQVTKSSTAPIRTLKGFIDKVFELTEKVNLNNSEMFYRGHSNRNKYKLEPSLFRKDLEGNYLYKDNEHILFRELIISHSSEFNSDGYTLDKLVRMQHYSMPTRLLDITSNPLISLYFACKSSPNEIGEVIIFSVKREKVKYYDSDTVSCIANLARLPQSEKRAIDFSNPKFNDQQSVERLIHFIKEEKPFFEPRITPENLRDVVCVKGKKSNDRISSQSGAFLLFGLDAVFSEEGTPEVNIARVAISNKAQILKELDWLNINESTVFPYIENSAIYVANKYKFSKPH